MRAVVVYESMYGNTRQSRRRLRLGSVSVSTCSSARRRCQRRGDQRDRPRSRRGPAPCMASRHPCRRAAAQATEEDGHGPLEPHAGDSAGLRSWLAHFSGTGLLAAAFSTRFDRSAALTGAAARGIARRLRRQGCTLVAKPESFFVIDSEGPLEDGEVARACAWGAALATHIPPEALSSVSPNRAGAQR